MEIKEMELLNHALDYVGTTIALLSEQDYWKKQLWRNVGNHKYEREADVHNAFIAVRLSNIGIHTTPIGCVWHHIAPEELHKKWYEKYEDIWKDYGKWCYAQR